MTESRRPRASPTLGRPPRVQRPAAATLGMALVAALDEPPRAARPRSDSTLSSDTFDGIYALGEDDVGVDVDDVDMDDLDDVLRPSALLDRKIEDVYGRTSDFERMLLSGHDVDADTEDVMRHLAQLDQQQRRCESGFSPLLPRGGCVVVAGAAAAVEALPARCVDAKRSAHKHTFGERASPFSFRFSTAAATARPASPVKVSARNVTTVRARTRRSRSLFNEVAEDIAGRNVCLGREENLTTASDEGDADHEMDDPEVTESEVEEVDDFDQPTPKGAPSAADSPLRPTSSSPRASCFQTPQRSSSTSSSFETPLVVTTPASDPSAATQMSPAPSFDKVAVVHAKDTPGKVDKFEWTIRSSTRLSKAAESTRGALVLDAHDALATTVDMLPPRYLSDPKSSPQKRRVHSSTFGSFARSFSFAT